MNNDCHIYQDVMYYVENKVVLSFFGRDPLEVEVMNYLFDKYGKAKYTIKEIVSESDTKGFMESGTVVVTFKDFS